MINDTMLLTLVTVIFLETSYLFIRQLRPATTSKATPVFVDTSVLIDERIIQVAETGFVPGKLVIPRSVIGELQLLADGSDNEKRERARRGLDVVKALQAIEGVTVEIFRDGTRAENGVDNQLLSLAKKYHGMICTVDFNLNKVAQVEGIRVLNINELAQQLRMTYMPGDHVQLELKHQGSDSHQAVGHLSDGTMVVVEQARSQIGKTVEVEVIRSLQTHAGRMMFARVVSGGTATQTPREHDKTAKLSKPAGRASTKRTSSKSESEELQKSAPKHHPSQRQSRYQTAKRGSKATSEPSTPAPKSSSRPRTARQSEASLIELVNNQRSER